MEVRLAICLLLLFVSCASAQRIDVTFEDNTNINSPNQNQDSVDFDFKYKIVLDATEMGELDTLYPNGCWTRCVWRIYDASPRWMYWAGTGPAYTFISEIRDNNDLGPTCPPGDFESRTDHEYDGPALGTTYSPAANPTLGNTILADAYAAEVDFQVSTDKINWTTWVSTGNDPTCANLTVQNTINLRNWSPEEVRVFWEQYELWNLKAE